MIEDNDGCSPVDICQMENTSLADSAAEYVPYEERPETYIVPVIDHVMSYYQYSNHAEYSVGSAGYKPM